MFLTGGNMRKGFTLFETVVVIGVFGVIITIVITIFTNASASQRREAVSQKALSDARLMLNTLQQDVRGQRIDYDFYKGNDEFQGPPAADASCASFTDGDQCNLLQSSGVTVLALVNDLGQKTRYWFDGTAHTLKVCRNNPIVAPRNCNGVGTNYQNITPNSLTLNRLSFVVTPASDPALRSSSQACSSNADCTCTKANITPGNICGSWTSGYCDAGAMSPKCLIPDVQPSVTASLELQSQGLAVGSVKIPMEITITTRSYVR